MLKKLFVILVFNLVVAQTAHALILIDTGVPGEGTGGYFLRDYQWMYGKVTFDQAVNVFSVETVMRNELPTPETYTLTFLNSNNGLPDLGSRYFEEQITVLGTQNASAGVFYFGSHNLDINIGAGDYWVGLEVGPNDNHETSVPRYAPSPLSQYIIVHPPNSLLNPTDSFNYLDYGSEGPEFGVRVTANELPGNIVPEPATLALFGAGFLGAVIRRKRGNVKRA